jgi:hypothetical protein
MRLEKVQVSIATAQTALVRLVARENLTNVLTDEIAAEQSLRASNAKSFCLARPENFKTLRNPALYYAIPTCFHIALAKHIALPNGAIGVQQATALIICAPGAFDTLHPLTRRNHCSRLQLLLCNFRLAMPSIAPNTRI